MFLGVLTKGNYRWGVWGIESFYKPSTRYIDLLQGSYSGIYPPENVLDAKLHFRISDLVVAVSTCRFKLRTLVSTQRPQPSTLSNPQPRKPVEAKLPKPYALNPKPCPVSSTHIVEGSGAYKDPHQLPRPAIPSPRIQSIYPKLLGFRV